jgi:hypothetical protein
MEFDGDVVEFAQRRSSRHADQVARKLSPTPKPHSTMQKLSARAQRAGRSLPDRNTWRACPGPDAALC